MKTEELVLSQKTQLRAKRNPTIDAMKFFLILAIYVGHYGTNSGLLFPFFSGYHVCVFFMLSGLWATKKRKHKKWAVKKRMFFRIKENDFGRWLSLRATSQILSNSCFTMPSPGEKVPRRGG